MTTYSGGDYGAAATATFTSPYGIATDAANNLYIADEGCDRVRKVDASSGIIYTVAGCGTAGFGGDGGPAISAMLNNPIAVAIDGGGCMYIGEAGNSRIRLCCSSAMVPGVSPASNTPIVYINTGEPFGTALVNYRTTTVSTTPRVNDALFGAAWSGGIPVLVYDNGSATGATAYVHACGSPPDVIIGEKRSTSALDDYIMAVAHNVPGETMVDFYDITAVGTTSVTVTFCCSVNISSVNVDPLVHHARIDLIAARTSTGRPICDTFILTWDDGTTYARLGTLNSYGFISGTTNIQNGAGQPDVAAIQKSVGGFVHKVGVFAYVDNTTGVLSYKEWNFNTALPISSGVLDASGSCYVPRIDANDDHTTNGNSSNVNWKVAAERGGDVRTYDNVINASCSTCYFASAGLLDMSGFGYTGAYMHHSPTVALMNPSQYAIFHWSEVSTATENAVAIMAPVNVANSYSLTPTSYYVVDSNGGSVPLVETDTVWLPATWRSSVSASVNCNYSDSIYTLFGFGFKTPAGNQMTEFKLTPSGLGLSFKPEPTPPDALPEQSKKWEIFPNPATNTLTIVNGTGPGLANRYLITDMTGRTVMDGYMAGNRLNINISRMIPGNYIIELYNDGKSCGHAKFVKN